MQNKKLDEKAPEIMGIAISVRHNWIMRNTLRFIIMIEELPYLKIDMTKELRMIRKSLQSDYAENTDAETAKILQ